MLHSLLHTLQIDGPLAPKSVEAIISAFSKIIIVRRHDVVLRESETPSVITAMIEGMALRHRHLATGKRQIVGMVVPGDLCDLSAVYFDRLDYGVEAVTDCTIATATAEAVKQMIGEHPDIGQALWRSTMRSEAVLREWVVNLGRRPAHQRIAHFLCEFVMRTRPLANTSNERRPFPLTQDEIADVTGLTVVHVNRVLQDLRSTGILTLERRQLTIHGWDRICLMAEFEAGYLHAGHIISAQTQLPTT